MAAGGGCGGVAVVVVGGGWWWWWGGEGVSLSGEEAVVMDAKVFAKIQYHFYNILVTMFDESRFKVVLNGKRNE